ncbi:MAG: hypothetical protein DRO39_08235, partial [Thermoprotei archaeon]
YEKLDSLIRHGAGWLNDVGLLIIDEVHFMGNRERGSSIEGFASELMATRDPQIIALSATVGNPEELAEWLGAELVVDGWRPVPLRKGVLARRGSGMVLYMEDGSKYALKTSSIENLVIGLMGEGAQVLVFRATRRMVETTAKKIAKTISGDEAEEVADGLELIKIPRYERATLRHLVRKGVAFHHAGLHPATKKFIEDSFREGLIRCIVCTSTLGAGINTPSKYVIVCDLIRRGLNSAEPMSRIEVEQFLGRAGRPGYDKIGVGLIYAKDMPPEEVVRRYLSGGPEEIRSPLGEDMYHFLLGKLSARRRRSELFSIVGRTLYAKQNSGAIADVDRRLGVLIRYGLVREDGGWIEATDLGRRIAQLYIRPSTAAVMIRIIRSQSLSPTEIFYLLSCTEDGRRAYPRDFDVSVPEGFVESISMSLGGLDTPQSRSAYYTAMILTEWIEEVDDGMIMQKYMLASGDFMSVRSVAEWLTYSLMELAKVIRAGTEKFEVLYYRTKYGVRAELVPIARIGLNRRRARALYEAGYRSVEDVAAEDPSVLSGVLGVGRRTAARIIRSARRIAGAG